MESKVAGPSLLRFAVQYHTRNNGKINLIKGKPLETNDVFLYYQHIIPWVLLNQIMFNFEFGTGSSA